MKLPLAPPSLLAAGVAAVVLATGPASGSAAQARPASDGEALRPLRLELAYRADGTGARVDGVGWSGVAAIFDAVAHVGLERFLPWRGTTALVHVHHTHGAAPSAWVGDAQGVSNIEAPEGGRVFEAWIQQNLGGRLSFLGGFYDLNSEFDVVPAAGLFVNSSFGIGPDFSLSGVHGPSIFPFTSLTLRIKAGVGGGGYVQAAALDGVPGRSDDPARSRLDLGDGDGALLVAEVGRARGLGEPEDPLADGPAGRLRLLGRGRDFPAHRDKLAVGGWLYAGGEAGGGGEGGAPGDRSWGGYVLGERLLRPEGAGPGVSGFARVGLRGGGPGSIDGTFSLGAVASGWPARPQDQTGLAVAFARTSDEFRQAWQAERGSAPAAGEAVIELTHALQLHDAFAFQPDLQVVLDPGGDPDRSPAWLWTLSGAVALSIP